MVHYLLISHQNNCGNILDPVIESSFYFTALTKLHRNNILRIVCNFAIRSLHNSSSPQINAYKHLTPSITLHLFFAVA